MIMKPFVLVFFFQFYIHLILGQKAPVCSQDQPTCNINNGGGQQMTIRFYFDRNTQVCRSFQYQYPCGTQSQNQFSTLAECNKVCRKSTSTRNLAASNCFPRCGYCQICTLGTRNCIGGSCSQYVCQADISCERIDRQGQCPQGINGVCSNECTFDSVCPANQKCCSTNCGGRVCRSPVNSINVQSNPLTSFQTNNAGFCPSVNGRTGTCTNSCSGDSQCSGNMKCCSNGCGFICTFPTQSQTQFIQPTVNAALTTSIGRLGECPAATPGTVSSCEVACNIDTDCPGVQRCCFNGCGRTCEAPVFGTRQGICPKQAAVSQTCGRLTQRCSSDTRCPGQQKCCYVASECSTTCWEPERRGVCPVSPNTQCFNYRDMCTYDFQCAFNQKCCYYGCGKSCVPILTCPRQTRNCQTKTNSCSLDSECQGGFRCCDDGCGRRCMLAVGQGTTFNQLPSPPTGFSSPFIGNLNSIGCPVPSRSCISRQNLCANDQGCPQFQKCCNLGCGTECIRTTGTQNTAVSSAFQTASQFCPPSTKRCSVRSNSCTRDNQCIITGQRCCDLGCGFECAYTQSISQGVKTGTCPIPVATQCVNRNQNCRTDLDCSGALKCCSNFCGTQCTAPVQTTNPNCPFQSKVCSVQTNLCQVDIECGTRRICCNLGCGNECVTPGQQTGAAANGIRVKSGVCSTQISTLTCQTIQNLCSNDYECSGTAKCCASNCGTKCRPPMINLSPQSNTFTSFNPHCPTRVVSGNCPSGRYDACTVNSQCGFGQLCCENGCGKSCMFPRKRKDPES